VGQNGYIDFDGKCRLIDADQMVKLMEARSVYPDKEVFKDLFDQGQSQVKKEVISQRDTQMTVGEWCDVLGISVIEEKNGYTRK
jgi:hypothetical protein